jgi:hypothetical protein
MQVALYKLKFILIYRLGYLFMFGATILECYFYCAASVIISAGAWGLNCVWKESIL